MRVRNRMWMEWTMVWDSCCCYMCNVPLDSSWLVSLTEEVSASFIISWRENKTYSWIKYSQLQIFKCAALFFPTWLTLFIHLFKLSEKIDQIIDITKTCFASNKQKSIATWGKEKWWIKISLLMPNAFKWSCLNDGSTSC